jgi:hypothetical protein
MQKCRNLASRAGIVQLRERTQRYEAIEATMSFRNLTEPGKLIPAGLSPAFRALFGELLEQAPVFVDRRSGAELISDNLFPVSHRSLEVWPLPTRLVNGRIVVPTAKLLEIAFAKLNAAPVVMSGRRTNEQEA